MRTHLTALLFGIGALCMTAPAEASWLSEALHNTRIHVHVPVAPAYYPPPCAAPVYAYPPPCATPVYVAPAYVAPRCGPRVYDAPYGGGYRDYRPSRHHHHHH